MRRRGTVARKTSTSTSLPNSMAQGRPTVHEKITVMYDRMKKLAHQWNGTEHTERKSSERRVLRRLAVAVVKRHACGRELVVDCGESPWPCGSTLKKTTAQKNGGFRSRHGCTLEQGSGLLQHTNEPPRMVAPDVHEEGQSIQLQDICKNKGKDAGDTGDVPQYSLCPSYHVQRRIPKELK